MNWQQKDKALVWHPYTQAKTAGDNIVITKGEGAYLFDEAGTRYIDGVSSWWTNIHGHGHPHIAAAIGAQAAALEQVIFAGFTHPAAILLAEKLLALLHEGFEKVFYSDNGSTAVEAAIKMAVQYHKNKGADRNKILCFRDAYHGDTFGAMSVSARGVFTDPYARLLFDVVFIDTPDLNNHDHVLSHFGEQVTKYKDEIAGFIFEPLVLGSAGMKMYAPHTLDALLAICKEQGIITIADEVFTGFGRTGRMFAIEHLSQVPDIICLSKGITGGFMPFAATIVQGFIYEPFHADERTKMLFHGHSYTGNPLGCAAALASLEVFEQEQTMSRVATIVESHRIFAGEVKNSSVLKDLRQCGTIVALEFKDDLSSGYLSSLRDRMYQFFIARQIILRPLGNVLYILPPYCISGKDLQSIYSAIKEFIATCEA